MMAHDAPPNSLGSQQLHSLQEGFQRLCKAIWDNGAACMFSVSLMFAFAGFVIKLLNADALRYSVFEIVAIRSGFAIPPTALSIRRMQQEDPENAPSMWGNRSTFKRLFLRGLFGACAMTSYYLSIQLLTLGDAVTLFFTNAVVTAIASVLIGYEKPTWNMVVASCTCAGGVLLISRPSFIFGVDNSGSAEHVLWGVIAALASSCFAAGAFLTIKAIGKDEQAITTALWFHTVSVIFSSVPMLFGLPFPPVLPTPHELLLLSFLVLSSFLGQLLLNRGFQLLTPSVAAAINLSQVVHARTLSVLFLGDHLPWTGVLGSLLIGGGVLAAQVGKAGNDVACEVETGADDEYAVPLIERSEEDEKSISPDGGALHVLNTSHSFEDRSIEEVDGLEMSVSDADDSDEVELGVE